MGFPYESMVSLSQAPNSKVNQGLNKTWQHLPWLIFFFYDVSTPFCYKSSHFTFNPLLFGSNFQLSNLPTRKNTYLCSIEFPLVKGHAFKKKKRTTALTSPVAPSVSVIPPPFLVRTGRKKNRGGRPVHLCLCARVDLHSADCGYDPPWPRSKDGLGLVFPLGCCPHFFPVGK